MFLPFLKDWYDEISSPVIWYCTTIKGELELFCKYVGECIVYSFKNRAGIITGPVALCGLDPQSSLWAWLFMHMSFKDGFGDGPLSGKYERIVYSVVHP